MNLEINIKRKTGKFRYMKIKHKPNDEISQREIKRKIKSCLETNGIRNTTYLKLWNTAKAVLTGKFIVINTLMKKKRKIYK